MKPILFTSYIENTSKKSIQNSLEADLRSTRRFPPGNYGFKWVPGGEIIRGGTIEQIWQLSNSDFHCYLRHLNFARPQ
jgi:hypothetical protein